MKERVCCSCGHVGKPVNQPMGSFLVDILAWCTFGSGAFISGMLGWLSIPVLWTLYHLYTFRSITCPACGDLEMVRKNSRKGRKALGEDNTITVWRPEGEVKEFKKVA